MNQQKNRHQYSRDESGQSVVVMLVLCVLSALWIAGIYGLLLPSYQRIGAVKANGLVRTAAETSLDWAVDQLNSSSTRATVDVQSGSNTRVVNVPSAFIPAGVTSATVTVLSSPCPSTAACSLPASVIAAMPSNPWRVVTATATLTSGKTKSVRAVLAPTVSASAGTSTATTTSSTPFFTMALGSYTSITGNTPSTPITTYSYDSNVGLGASKQTTGGDIAANGNIDLGNMKVGGNVRTFGSVGSGNVTASSASINQALIASGTANGAVVGPGGGSSVSMNVLNASNVSNPIQTNVASTPIPQFPIPAHSTAANLPSSGNISAGQYKVNSLTDQTLTVTSGPVDIFVEGPSASIQWTGNIKVNSGHPSDLRIWYTGSEDVALDNGKQLTAVVYAPNAMVHFDNGGKLYGAVMGNSVVLDNGSSFFYDRQLANAASGLNISTTTVNTVPAYAVTGYRTISWQEDRSPGNW